MKALGMIEVIGLTPAIEAADAALKAANVTLLAIAKADAGILTVEITGDVGAVIAAVDAGATAAERVGTLRGKHVIPHVDESLVGKVLMKGTKLFQPKKEPTIPINQSVNSEFLNSKEDGVEKVDKDSLPSAFSRGSTTTVQNSQVVGSHEKDSVSYNYMDMGRDDIYGESTIIGNKDGDKISEIMNMEIETKSKESGIHNEKSGTMTESSGTNYTVTDLKKKSNDTLRAILQSQGVELTELHKSAKKQELIQLIIAQQNRR